MGSDEHKEQMKHRGRAKDITNNRFEQWINGMLPVIIDGTGKEYDKISRQKAALEEIGYDTSMVFVNTSLEVALKANAERGRSVRDDLVTQSWHDTQENLGKYQNLFGAGNMLIVDNTKRVSGDDLNKLSQKLFKAGMKFINSPLKNQKGRWIISELNKHGKLYLSDLLEYNPVKI
jgi:tRNA uridine 5-carbamoylmethylation protein Kti12